MKCSYTRNLIPKPNDFLNELMVKIPHNIKHIIKKIIKCKKLSYIDTFVIINYLLPPSIFNDWPSVDIETPLNFPEVHSFNSSFSKEWYYMNTNGYTTTGERFYILRVLTRTGTIYKNCLEGSVWLFSDVSMLTIVDKNGSPTIVRSIQSYPCISSINKSLIKDLTEDLYYIQGYPFKISKISKGVEIILFELNEKGDLMSMSFNDDELKFSYNISAKCNKPILLQGKNLDGLDPGSNQFISQITGASYMYYSWPSWEMIKPLTINYAKNIWSVDNNREWNMWLDHQGGNVKDSRSELLSQFSIILGLRPLSFPGWNWFSIQFFNGVQWTGFSNKPWKNKKKYNRQQVQGTWDDESGKLRWIYATLKITKWWTSPDSGLNFGIEYEFDFGKYGKYLMKSIADDQRVLVQGTETYEGGVNIYKLGDNKNIIGYGNIECVGWPSVKQNVNYALKYINFNKLNKNEKNKLIKGLTPSVMSASILILILFFIIIFLFIWLFQNLYKFKDQNTKLTISIFTSFSVTLILFIYSFILLKTLGCNTSKTCAIGKWNGCIFNCPS